MGIQIELKQLKAHRQGPFGKSTCPLLQPSGPYAVQGKLQMCYQILSPSLPLSLSRSVALSDHCMQAYRIRPLIN